MQNNPNSSSDLPWLLARCALGELSPAQQQHLEELLLHDELLCQQLADTAELLLTLRHIPPAAPLAAPAHVASHAAAVTTQPRSRRLATITTVTALAALALLVTAPGSGQPEILGDAVTLSSLLQTENHDQRSSDTESWTTETDLPEPPDWLLTALDLDEQNSENLAPAVDDEDEAVF